MTDAAVTIVGGGVFAPVLCETLARADGLPSLDLRLAARRRDRLAVIARHAAARVAAIQPAWRVTAPETLATALAGADVVVLLVRVGGLAARAWDESFPVPFGLVGDEGLGVGGMANAWRTLPVLEDIARAIARDAPGARVLNLMAPLGMTTRLLVAAGLDAVGVCELPCVTERAFGHRGLSYGGLNHLGWFWNAAADPSPLAAAAETGLGDADVLARHRAVPLRYFYEVFDRPAARRLGLARRPGRARTLLRLSEAAVERFAERPGVGVPELACRPTPWFDEAVAPILRAVLGGRPHRGFANVVNDGLLPELPAECVVEVRARYDAAGVHAEAPGPLPPAVSTFLSRVAEAESLAYGAVRRADVAAMGRAIAALPLSMSAVDVRRLARLVCRQETAV